MPPLVAAACPPCCTVLLVDNHAAGLLPGAHSCCTIEIRARRGLHTHRFRRPSAPNAGTSPLGATTPGGDNLGFKQLIFVFSTLNNCTE